MNAQRTWEDLAEEHMENNIEFDWMHDFGIILTAVHNFKVSCVLLFLLNIDHDLLRTTDLTCVAYSYLYMKHFNW